MVNREKRKIAEEGKHDPLISEHDDRSDHDSKENMSSSKEKTGDPINPVKEDSVSKNKKI